jgi:hypothetical protein
MSMKNSYDTIGNRTRDLPVNSARTAKFDYCRFSWGGLHGKDVVVTGKGKTGTIPAFAIGRATWEGCSGNWERKNGNHPSICYREGYMGRV